MVLTIWDNNGESLDKYTVRIDDDYFGMSSNATSHNGFNQFVRQEVTEKRTQATTNGSQASNKGQRR